MGEIVMRFMLLFLLAVLFISCSDKMTVEVVKTNAGPNSVIQNVDPIYFEFNTDLWDMSKFSEYLNQEYLIITPKLSGSYNIMNSRTLQFLPAYGALNENTVYTVQITDKVLGDNKKLKLGGTTSYKFLTAKLEVVSFDYYWGGDKNGNSRYLNVKYSFNMPIEFAVDSRHFAFELNGKNILPELTSNSSNTDIKLSFNFDKSNVPDDVSKFKIIIAEGNRIGNNLGSSLLEKFEDVREIGSINEFNLTFIDNNTNNYNSEITLKFSHALLNDFDYRQFLNIDNQNDYEISIIENSLIITNSFEPASSYQIILKKGLPSELSALDKDIVQSIYMQDIGSVLNFTEEEAMYLPMKGSRNIGVEINAVENLYMTIYKVYENNLLNLFRGIDQFYEYEVDEDGNESYFYGYDTKRYGEPLFTGKIVKEKLAKKGNVHLLNIDFKDYISDRGIYLIRLFDSTNKSLSVDKVVSISDLGIIAKTNNDEVFVSVNSIQGAVPISGAKVKLISFNNQNMTEGTTNADGSIIFKELSKRKKAKIPAIVRVEKGSDVNYLFLDTDKQMNTSVFDFLGGSEKSGYKAFVYSDRELYRPGDSAFFSAIVRDEKRSTLKQLPVTLKLMLPNYKVLREFFAETDENGGLEIKYKIPQNAITGNYIVKAFTSSKLELGVYKFSVEQFIPERIKLSIKTDKENYKINDILKVKSLVENLYGSPATGRTFDYTISYKSKVFKNRELQNYKFDIENTSLYEVESSGSGISDSKGEIVFDLALSQLANCGNLEALINVSAMDESGRYVKANKKVQIATQNYYLGIGKTDNWLSINRTHKVPVIAVNSEGKSASNVKARIEIYRKVWRSVAHRSEYSDYVYYNNEESFEQMVSRDVTIGGRDFAIPFKPTTSGIYEIRVSLPDAQSYVKYEYMVYSDSYVSTTAFEVNKEGYIDIYSESDSYFIGEKAKLMFRTPFNGRLIVTVERHGVIESYSLSTKNKTAELVLDIKDSYLPNIYVSAVLVKPIVDSEIPINVAYGYLPLKIDNKSSILPVSINVPNQIRSNTTQTVRVKTSPRKNINLTVAVVDEGIHQVKKTKSPDPHGFFYEKIALGISTFDIYKYIFPELKSSKLAYGGGEGYEELMDNFLFNKFADERVKPLALWSGILKTNEQGEAVFTFFVPEFSGSLRVSAVAYYDENFGKADTNIFVKDPIIASMGLPRFLSAKDLSEGSVLLSNTTNNEINVKFGISGSGPVKISNLKSSNALIPANSEKRIRFDVQALNYEGLGEITFSGSYGSEKFSQKVKLPVRYSLAYQKTYESGILSNGNTKNITHGSEFEKGTSITNVIISRYPVVEFFNSIDYLNDYPYGCMEQIVSKAFPMLYFPELANVSSDDSDRYKFASAKEKVTTVIDRIKMLQLYDGGWALWESEYNSHWWTTSYVSHFLLSAQKAGYNVDPTIINRALNNLKDNINFNSGPEKKIIHRLVSNNIVNDKYYYRKEIFYSLFTLSLAGKSNYSAMNLFKNKIREVSSDSRSLLAAAFKLSGDEVSFNSIIAEKFEQHDNYSYLDNYSFSSGIRDLALSLYAIALVSPYDLRIPDMTKNLAKLLKNNTSITTQDAAFGFMALGMVLKSDGRSSAKGYANNGKIEIARISEKNKIANGTSRTGSLIIKSENESKMYYFANTIGVPKGGVFKEQDNKVKVRREYYGKAGNFVNLNNIKVGDIICVKLILSSIGEKIPYENMVITDLLPAGFEIENPRLSEINSYPWIKKTNIPQHYDYRDDRVNLYFNYEKDSEFYYTIRAVSPGKFKLGSVTASAMYNSEVFSISGKGEIQISR